MVGRHGLVVRSAAGLALAGALALVTALAAAPSTGRSALACTPSWHAVPIAPTPNGWEIDELSAQSPTDAWAAGGDGLNAPAFVEHWDGAEWKLSWQGSSEDVSPWSLGFNGVAAAGPSAAWAVGARGYRVRPVIMSWDGSSWRVDHIPKLPDQSSLYDVAAVSAKDVWAVGLRWKHLRSWTLIEHWDGNSWKVVPSPNGGPSNFVRTPKRYAPSGREPLSASLLSAVAVISPDDIWALGGYDRALPGPKAPGMYRPAYRVRLLSEHWNGTKWTLGPTPVMQSDAISRDELPTGGFDYVAAAPSGDVMGLTDGFQGRPWWFSGSAWKPDPSWTPMYSADAITVTGHDDAWVMGWRTKKDDLAAVHWDGSQWATTELPATGVLDAASASGPDDIWAAGQVHPRTGHTGQQVMLHYTC